MKGLLHGQGYPLIVLSSRRTISVQFVCRGNVRTPGVYSEESTLFTSRSSQIGEDRIGRNGAVVSRPHRTRTPPRRAPPAFHPIRRSAGGAFTIFLRIRCRFNLRSA